MSEATRPHIVAALYVDPAGPYVGRAGVDPWDEARDARAYPGPLPVVAHPPCERWGRFAEGSPVSKRFKLGDDGGCFQAALAAVRAYGGVLEHPQGSKAFETFGLPIPRAGRRRGNGWTVQDAWGGRSCHIDQGAYGHKAQKPTWLYAVLPAYPELDWRRTWDMPYRIGGQGFHSQRERARAKAKSGGIRKDWLDLPKAERHITPPALRDALVSLASSCAFWQPSRLHVQEVLT